MGTAFVAEGFFREVLLPQPSNGEQFRLATQAHQFQDLLSAKVFLF
ncbi:MAG TPA: hypothetical protein VFZ49_07895 [Pyrinomonadaceae bacterium]